MLFQFVNVLLQVLVHKSHDLLQEEIGIATYNMASVDFDGFYSAFLPEFLASCDGVDSNQKNVLGRNFKMDRVRRGLQHCGRTVLPQNTLGMSPGSAFCSQHFHAQQSPAKDFSVQVAELPSPLRLQDAVGVRACISWRKVSLD